MNKPLLAAALALTFASALRAGEVEGVRMADTVVAEGKTVKLNGMGLRTRIIFKVYVAGLYLENPSHDPSAIIQSDQVKRVELGIVRSLTGAQVAEAIGQGFEQNSKSQMGALKARLDKLESWIPDVDKGDSIVLTYVPGKGTIVWARLTERGVIEGKDFSDALLSVWLGPNPVQADLKRKLLGLE
ncbi:MAG TPA: chalcone isomerase family protein [Thermoanaerobaculia bacterium]|nr:chalcone isomerase family protein [Thermoanaerobaculia bacterium]